MMKPRITAVTLGVDDLEKALVFYRDGLDLPTEGIVGKEFEHGAFAFFDLQPGLRLAPWPWSSSVARSLRSDVRRAGSEAPVTPGQPHGERFGAAFSS